LGKNGSPFWALQQANFKVEPVDILDGFQSREETQVKQSSYTQGAAPCNWAQICIQFSYPYPSSLSIVLEIRIFSRFCWEKDDSVPFRVSEPEF
jgi:hypothetical protein